MTKDPLSIPFSTQGCQGSNYRQGYSWNGDELEEAREDGRNKIKQLIQRWDIKPTQNATNDEGSKP